MTSLYAARYRSFVFFSAGPVGDHVILIDFANRFFVSTGIPSIIVMKHPNAFLADFALPYKDHISYVNFSGIKGRWAMLMLTLRSVLLSYCYINVLPVPPPLYYKVFARFIRFCTRSRFVGFNLEGSRNFPIGKGSSYFLGKANYLEAQIDKKLFYEEENRMLAFLGFDTISVPPIIGYVSHPEVLARYALSAQKYLIVHIQSSHPDRTFPVDRWNHILKELRRMLPDVTFVFTGATGDEPFITEALIGVSGPTILVCGKVNTQELLTLHANAKLNVTVHTGNMHFINMLHVPTVNLNIKGIYFFKPYYNEKATELVSTQGCTCDPYERQCTMIAYKDVEYMACLFNIPDADVIEVVTSRYLV